MNSISIVSLIGLLAPSAPRGAQDIPPAPVDLCEVRVASPAEQARLFRLASDPDDHFPVRDGRMRIHADAREQRRLIALGFDLSVLQRDLAAFYAARAAADPARLTVGGSMGGFKTLAEIVAEMDRLAATYPGIVSPKFSIGTSVEGRPIWAMRVSDNPAIEEAGEPRVYLDAIHHAREPMGGEALLLFADDLCTGYPSDPECKRMVETRDILFVPCVNPDGYEYNRQTNPGGGGLWRKNRRNNGGSFGIDLNRNYGWEWGAQWPGSSGTPSDDTYRGPSPFSEPETRAVRDWQTAHPPAMALSAHTYGNLWLFPWGYDTVLTPDDSKYRAWGAAMTATNGFEAGSPPEILYVANGGSFDWSYGQLAAFAFTPEIGSDSDGFWPAPSRILPLYESVKAPLAELVKWSGAWPEVGDVAWTQVQGDGDAFREPGEVWDLEVGFVNPGVLSASGTITLTSPHPEIAVVNGFLPFQVGATVFQATHLPGGTVPEIGFQPLRLRIAIAAGAESGSYELDLALGWENLTSPALLPVDVGQLRVLARDDMEIAGFGWQVDNALNYSWQRAVPQQTTSGGQTAQPGNDDPAGVGTMCWVTGAAAGAAVGSNDVDGTTVLTSPVFRASGFSHVSLEYARWFADLPGSATDDQLLVQVSNNGGTGWTTLETTANANSWQTVAFDLEDVLPLSDSMRLRFTASDNPSNSLCEALVDSLVLRTFSTLPTLGAWGATSAGATARFFVDGPSSVSFTVKLSTSAGSGTTTPGTAGLLYLTGSISDVANGATAASGRAELPWSVPAGTTLYLQALLDENGPQAAWSNLLTVIVQ